MSPCPALRILSSVTRLNDTKLPIIYCKAVQHQTYSYIPKMATMATASSISHSNPEIGYHPPRPRKFAPLNPQKVVEGSLPTLRGIIFDVDGTLCLPQNYMFKQMRDALQIPKSVDILDHIRSLSNEPDQSGKSSSKPTSTKDRPSPPSEEILDHTTDTALPDETASSPQSRAVAAIKKIESEAMTSQTPQPGLAELMTYLDSRKVLRGLCTRNFPAPVQNLIDNFLKPHGVDFTQDEIVTRESEGIQPKPSPEGIWKIAKFWSNLGEPSAAETVQEKNDGANEDDVLDLARKYLGSGLIMVGDSIDDMAAGYRAGAATVLLVNKDNEWLAEHEYTDLAVKRLDDLIGVLEDGFVGNVSM